MASAIGPRIKVDGEADYRKAMSSIIQQQKTLKAEMQETATAFDKNASSQEKAKAKMDGLNKQIDLQKQKVEELRKMTEKAAESTDVSAEDTLKYKEALAKAQSELNKMETEQQELSEEIKKAPYEDMKKKLGEVSDKLKKVGDSMKDFGDKMTKYVTGPIAAIAGLSVKAFKDVDDASDSLRKATGKTGSEFEDLWDTTQKIATTLPVSLEDASAAVGEISTRFDASGQGAADLATKFLKFANITDTDVTGAIDGAQKAMAAWNLSSDKAGSYLDAIASVSQNTGADINTLNTSLASNKVLFDDMGMSVFTAAGFLGELDKNGLDSNAVLAGLKKALQNATKEGKPLDEALEELTDTMTSSTTDTEAYAAAMELFGNKAGPQLADALRDGRVSFTDFARVAGSSMGTVESTFEDTLDPIDRYQSLLNQLKLTGAEVGGTLLELLAPAVEKIAEAIEKVATWWGNLSPEMKNTILIVGGIVAAIGPLLSILGTIVSIISGMIPIMAALSAANISLSASLAPILVAIGVIVLVVGLVVLAIKHWGEITEWLGGVWESVTGWIKGAAEDVGNWVSDKWNKVTEWTSQAWSDVKEWTSEAWDNVKNTVKNAAEAVGNWVSEKWDNLKQKTSEAWGNIKQKVAENGGGIKGIVKTVSDQMKENWRTAFDTINNITGGKLGEVLQKVRDKLQAIKQKFTDIFDGIKDFVKGALDKIKSFFSNLTLKLPHIKLPHFKLTGKFSLNPPSIPKITVDWYKKAYDNAVVFSKPTILATSAGLKGFGDGSGAEMVIGQRTLLDTIETAMRNVGGNNTYDISISVYGAEGQDVDDIASAVAERLSFEISRREAALV